MIFFCKQYLTETGDDDPSPWKLQVTEAELLITSVEVKVHGSFASVPFSTGKSVGVYTSTAETWTIKNIITRIGIPDPS